MLTREGYLNRFWQGYPQLRRLLEGKEDGIATGPEALLSSVDELDGPRISIDHGSLGRLADILVIARLLSKHEAEVQTAITERVLPGEQITAEVKRLLNELQSRIEAFLGVLARSYEHDVESALKVARRIDEQCRQIDGRERT
jgi:hypothetical protein